MGDPSNDIADELDRILGGTVRDLRRLSGGASRITSAFDLVADDGSRRPLILQQQRGDGIVPGSRLRTEAALLASAQEAGVPVPQVVAAGEADGLPPGWLIVERLEGETIPRKLLRDPEWAAARNVLTSQCGTALAAIHRIDPDGIVGLPKRDPLGDPLQFLDGLGEVRPALEIGARWLELNRTPSDHRVTVHGDFRMGNFLVGPDGLRAVLDWELAHAGDPAEDIGWLCARSWRFGGASRVGGFGDLTDLLDSYAAAGGDDTIDSDRVRWWEVYAAVKWAVICALQAAAHLGGATRSVELAAIGRRVCESEWDLLTLLDLTSDDMADRTFTSGSDAAFPTAVAPFGRPTSAELVQAVREHLESGPDRSGRDRTAFDDRVARNVLLIVERELQLGPAIARAHVDRLVELGFTGDTGLAQAIRSGAYDDDLSEVGRALAVSARDQLLVANPSYLVAFGN
ncbi:MAG TPA: phosphotransferase family protein [Acidimicrobiales bacterium]